ncbi:protein associated with UVRAG as autophagy enhancer isoform X1 [Tachysurus fulvidraco]|uniref:protein associated with UVRAG as autophagy enhancer isoform X1 n=2 Tax=Tachysurus fulvidraco TaxID=1234273 RepID=UPI000F4FD994|nr:protein associated with UVRAG as autophagy enhancer isoform X1 [Tachysurus fulvidraco]
MSQEHIGQMSLPDSHPDSNGCGSASYKTNLRFLSGNILNEQGSISKESKENERFYLPRSSPVISRSQEKKMKKLSSVALNNKVFHEHTAERIRKRQEPSQVGLSSVSKTLQNIFSEEQTFPPSASLCLDTHCAPASVMEAECSDKQRNPKSQSSSCEDHDLLNTGTSPREEHEEQISEAFYRNSVNLDQENAHFVVVDMVLEVLEAAKWALSQKHSDSFSSTDSGYEELCDHRHSSRRSSETSLGRCSAEILAQSLLMELERSWITSEELLGEFPLVTVSMSSGGEASLSDEIRQKSRMRGTLIWSPPQFQIITSVNPTQRRSEVITSQQFLCAGCGTEIEPRYMKRLRYCDYLGKYFCDGCHGGGEAVIPARVLNHWDFGRYPVCQFSKQILESIWEKPLFKITDVAKNLYAQAKELQKFKELQEQLLSIKKLLRTCRLSKGVLAEFQQLPTYLSEELHLFAMNDLVMIKRGQLVTTAKAVMRSATYHVEACELCQAKGFICEFCRGKDVLFPFQTDICTRCKECRACFHTSCFRDEACPRCARLQSRRSRT